MKRDKEWSFVLGDDHGHEIDVHVFIFDAQGNVEKGIMYLPGSLTGTGTIEGHTVRCISADWMAKFHSGYQVKEKDFRDVSALCERFGLDLPEEYLQFKRSSYGPQHPRIALPKTNDANTSYCASVDGLHALAQSDRIRLSKRNSFDFLSTFLFVCHIRQRHF